MVCFTTNFRGNLFQVSEKYESNSDNNDNGLVVGGPDHVEYVVDRVTMKKVLCAYFGFSCQFSLHRLLHIHWSFYHRSCIVLTVTASLSYLKKERNPLRHLIRNTFLLTHQTTIMLDTVHSVITTFRELVLHLSSATYMIIVTDNVLVSIWVAAIGIQPGTFWIPNL
jgi:hypothetical protein